MVAQNPPPLPGSPPPSAEIKQIEQQAVSTPPDVKPYNLSLEDAIVRAIKNSPQRDIAFEQINQAAASVNETRGAYLPQVSAKSDIGPEYNDPFAVRAGATDHDGYNSGRSGGINVRQMLFDGFVTRETLEQRLQLVESAKYSHTKVSEELISSTAEAYMQFRQYQQVVVYAKDNLDALSEIARLIDLRLAAGDASKIEQNYITSRVAAARQEYVSAQSALNDAFSALIYLIGNAPVFDATPPNLDVYPIPPKDALMQQATAANTDLRTVKSDQTAAKHALGATQGKLYPTVDFVVDGNESEDLGGHTGLVRSGLVKVELNYKIFDGGIINSAVSGATAKVRELDAREEEIKRELTQDVTKAFNKRETTQQELKATQDQLKADVDLEALYRKQFAQGDIDITLLVESQERIFASYQKITRLESDEVNLTFQLLRLMGGLLPKFCEGQKQC